MPSSSSGESCLELQILHSFKTVFARLWLVKLQNDAHYMIEMYADMLDTETNDLFLQYDHDWEFRAEMEKRLRSTKLRTNMFLVSCELANLAALLLHYGGPGSDVDKVLWAARHFEERAEMD